MAFNNEFFSDLGESLSKAAKELSGRAEVVIETQKLRSKIVGEERAIKKIKADIGNAVYQKYAGGETVDADFNVLCEKIKQHLDAIEVLKEKTGELNAAPYGTGSADESYAEETPEEFSEEDIQEEFAEETAEGTEKVFEELQEAKDEEMKEAIEELIEEVKEESEA